MSPQSEPCKYYYALSNGRGGRIWQRLIGRHSWDAAWRLAKLSAERNTDRDRLSGDGSVWRVLAVSADPIPRDM